MGIDPATPTEAATHAHRDVERRSPGRGSHHVYEGAGDLNSHERATSPEPPHPTTAAAAAAGPSTATDTGATPVAAQTSTRLSTSNETGAWSKSARRKPQPSTKTPQASASTPSSTSRAKPAPPGPVLVNPAPSTDPPPSSTAMYLSSPFSSLRRHPPTLDHAASPSHHPHHHSSAAAPRSRPAHQVPAEAHFAFADILSAALDAPAAQADVDAIAALCGRSRLSLASAHAAHRRPVGACADPERLSTVDEAAAAGRAGDPAPREPGAADNPEAEDEDGAGERRRGYDAAGVWQARARDGPPTAGGVVALSADAASLESRSSSAASLAERPAEGDSRAVRALMRVAGGG